MTQMNKSLYFYNNLFLLKIMGNPQAYSNRVTLQRSMSTSVVMSSMRQVFISQQPKQLQKFNQIFNTFELPVWLALGLMFGTAAIVFKLIHSIYSLPDLRPYNLAGQVIVLLGVAD